MMTSTATPRCHYCERKRNLHSNVPSTSTRPLIWLHRFLLCLLIVASNGVGSAVLADKNEQMEASSSGHYTSKILPPEGSNKETENLEQQNERIENETPRRYGLYRDLSHDPTTAYIDDDRHDTDDPDETDTSNPPAIPDWSLMPSSFPSTVPSQTPSQLPTKQPSDVPTSFPSPTPSDAPSTSPSDAPSYSGTPPPSISNVPSDSPSPVPTQLPSTIPSVGPTQNPSETPSMLPSEVPSLDPSPIPTNVPSVPPSENPTFAPSSFPSIPPSDHPTVPPSESPSLIPSIQPSSTPSDHPSSIPSPLPSSIPSDIPSLHPSISPVPSISPRPSVTPSTAPSISPSISPQPSYPYNPSSNPTNTPTFGCDDSKGEFGDTSGSSSLISFFYQMETDPSTTASVTDDILPALELLTMQMLMKAMFVECADVRRRNVEVTVTQFESSRVQHEHRKLGEMVGMSSQPSDIVRDEFQCSDPGAGNDCIIVSGRLTIFMNGEMTDEDVVVKDTLRDGMVNDELVSAHDAIRKLTYMDSTPRPVDSDDAVNRNPPNDNEGDGDGNNLVANLVAGFVTLGSVLLVGGVAGRYIVNRRKNLLDRSKNDPAAWQEVDGSAPSWIDDDEQHAERSLKPHEVSVRSPVSTIASPGHSHIARVSTTSSITMSTQKSHGLAVYYDNDKDSRPQTANSAMSAIVNRCFNFFDSIFDGTGKGKKNNITDDGDDISELS